MNGAEVTVRTLQDQGIDLCLANPGTSEMHFLGALDAHPGLRPVLVLQENVATGAADGFARIAGRPAATLLHLGPGLANGLSNLHNAARALSPIVNIVGDHATAHRRLDAPLTSDIEALSRTVSVSTRTILPGRGAAAETAAAVADSIGAKPGIATVLLPADAAWSDADLPDSPLPRSERPGAEIDDKVIQAALNALNTPGAILFLGHRALRGTALQDAARIAAQTGAALMAQTANPVTDRGAGRTPVERLPFARLVARERLKDVPVLVLAGAAAPVAFFGYPQERGQIYAPHTYLVELSRPEDDTGAWLAALAKACDAPAYVAPDAPARPDIPEGPLDAAAIGAVLAHDMPEGTILVDECVTNGVPIFNATAAAAPHQWLQNMGGSIGYGAPVSVGAALAAPDTPVLAIIGDGSAMYSLQALWTQARENLNVTTLILANRSYRILQGEVGNLTPRNRGATMQDMLEIDRPTLDFVKMAEGMGVPGRRVADTAALRAALAEAFNTPGPMLIELTL
ncbi:acetolactate synthase large subunit [Sulfitobacter pseudonitzschiae]|uniref:Acetolactate synthase large subunit n=1 Tax=Pseudosulfitobacter pseudonitzschiae TaxID=1402135 RepID=A0A9Q2NNF2_9RHOB|nr:acetolactate synthase large subunit [Pseudosulfitobacter pseudonitzschiae]MBM2293923.1 acetolactate synthase large subunit [Pseudosulfitobacter pseudonitzschiae]MBM2298840.1 acetolactate synthase large subunit [Pseudosulfitobacter pseudonitzschiae]MBM2303754.1 acetolactate synthase large subunit [Pseudosulfitobacter pseudonitzschiae]MBM2313537.1 acetolactate synthase large subunit [Pseudosulfitobacter pseudonitzschiae]MBM2318451.1 acetolactate synthase large subunit [Pseudosulfitobacter pse